MKFDNYSCEGQMNLWDLFKPKENLCELKADDTVCKGCKWRNNKNRELEVDKNGQTWVYKCPGTACTNWRNGTPLNLSFKSEIEESEKMYCYNRDFLPDLETVLNLLEKEFNLKFRTYVWKDGDISFRVKYKNVTLEIDESKYTYEERKGQRYIGAGWSAHMDGSSMPCDNLYEIFRKINQGIEHAEFLAKEKKKEKNRGKV